MAFLNTKAQGALNQTLKQRLQPICVVTLCVADSASNYLKIHAPKGAERIYALLLPSVCGENRRRKH